MRGELCLGEARISAGDLLLELKSVPRLPKDAATAPTSSQPAQISLPLRVRKNARKRERTRSGGSVSLHAWPPPAWAVAPSAAELRMDAFEGRDNRRAPPKEKNENVFKKVSDSARFPSISQLELASTASRRCHAASTTSMQPPESLRASCGSRCSFATLSFHTGRRKHGRLRAAERRRARQRGSDLPPSLREGEEEEGRG